MSVLKIKWNLNMENAIDYNLNEDSNREESHPNGFIMGWVNLNELLNNMNSFCKRKLKEGIYSEERNKSKIDTIISRISNGELIVPPYLDEIRDYLVIKDGWHRLTICLTRKEDRIPIFISFDKKEIFNKKINNIQWL